MSPLQGLTLRPISADDVGAVAEIHVTAFHEPGAEALERATASVREELDRPWARVWVACAEARVVGAFVAWIVADEVHVLDVATHPDVRRRGVGRALVTELVALARREHALHMYLEVRRSNEAAIALYRGAGFAAVGLRERYYGDDEDALEMALTFDASTGAIVVKADDLGRG